MPCLKCQLDPSTHSFEKIGELQREKRVHVFYTTYKSMKDHSNAADIEQHILDELRRINGEQWIWIIDCKFIQAKHMVHINVPIRLLKILNGTFGDSLINVFLINSGPVIASAIIALKPFITRQFESYIRKISGSPLELHEVFIKTYAWSPVETEPVIRRIMRDYA